MSYQEKKTIVSVATGLLVLAAYCLNVFTGLGAAPADLRGWAVTMLVFIGIGVAAAIVINIVFHIVLAVMGEVQKRKTIDEREDEMDKLISMKSMRVGYAIVGFGFVASLLSIVLGFEAPVMLNIIFLSGGAASLTEGFVSLYFYRKGVQHA